MTVPVPILPSRCAWALHDAAASRRVEQAALAAAAPTALMRRAGFGVARLALAVAPHAQAVWVAAGPGNNGGDGLIAARHLLAAGRRVRVGLAGDPQRLPADAAAAWRDAQAAGVPIDSNLEPPPEVDLALDALLGLGASRPPQGPIAAAIAALNSLRCPVLAVDLPSGIGTDTGQPLGADAVRAHHTLALLTLKPGLFTAAGRDHAGRIWFDDLDLAPDLDSATARLAGPPAPHRRRHVDHKGSFGDVAVIGGAPGMGGAALLAAAAALAAGAGRVLLARLDDAPFAVDPTRPELMPRAPADVLRPDRLAACTVVCGCGGGSAIAAPLPPVLAHAGALVVDADALNAVAADPTLAAALAQRADRGQPTVITPHPLEAARLAGTDTATVQADRLAAAQALCARLRCTVVLKGSGTVIASPGCPPVINPTGNARLGTAGSGDVLAGWLGGWLAAGARSDDPGAAAHDAAVASVWLHGRAAEVAAADRPLTAAALPAAMVRAAALLADPD
jgi:hydroxyethylthiazole kinase-like uncharacterized protein yjeF